MTAGTNDLLTGSQDATLIVERIERLEEEKKGIGDDIKDAKAEWKSRGFDPKMLAYVLAQRKLSREERLEQRTMQETYLNALGLL